MNKWKIYGTVILMLMLASIISECIGTKIGENNTGKTATNLEKAESSGIFSEKFDKFTDNSGYNYDAVYNNGYELHMQGLKNRIMCNIYNSDHDRDAIVINNDGTASYGHRPPNDFAVTWDKGRIDPRSDNDLVDRAKEFMDACKRKDNEMRDRKETNK